MQPENTATSEPLGDLRGTQEEDLLPQTSASGSLGATPVVMLRRSSSVEKCLDEVDASDGLTDTDKSYAIDIFKLEINREIFIKMKNKNVRFIWLKRQISALAGGNV